MSAIDTAINRPFEILLAETPITPTAFGQAAAAFVIAYAIDNNMLSAAAAVRLIDRFLCDPQVAKIPRFGQAWCALREDIRANSAS